MNTNPIKIQSVKIIARFLRIMADTDLLSVPEMNTIIANDYGLFMRLSHKQSGLN
jgi:hypothetical protein